MIFYQISILDTLHTFSHFTGRHGIPKMKILVLNIYLIAKIYDENLSQLLYTKMILYLKKTRTSAKNYRKKSKLKNWKTKQNTQKKPEKKNVETIEYNLTDLSQENSGVEKYWMYLKKKMTLWLIMIILMWLYNSFILFISHLDYVDSLVFEKKYKSGSKESKKKI